MSAIQDGLHERVREKDDDKKRIMKKNADITNHANSPPLMIGDNMLLKPKKCNKLTTPLVPKPCTVIVVKETMVTAKRQNHEVTRNSSYFKLIPGYVRDEEQSDNDSTDDEKAEPIQQEVQQQESQLRRYPLRRRKSPERLNL